MLHTVKMELQKKSESTTAHGAAYRDYQDGAKKLASKFGTGASLEIVQDALKGVVWALRGGFAKAREGQTPFDLEEVQSALENFFERAAVPEKYRGDFDARGMVYGIALNILMSETLAEVPRLLREK